MSTLIAKNIQVGADGTASNNFTIFQPATPDGTLRIGNGNSGITSSSVAITSSGNVGIGTSSPSSLLSLYKYQADYGIGLYGSAQDWTIKNVYSAGGALQIANNGGTRATIDSSGNLQLINSNNVATITQTAITLTGAGAGGTGGQTVNIITSNSTTRGVLIVGSTQNCSAIFFINASNAVNLSSQTTNETRFSATSGAANTANVYMSGSNIVLQNNIQATRNFYVTFIGSI